MYGGVQGFFLNRVIVDYGLRVWMRIAFPMGAFHFIGSVLGQREYDANAYDYFYFSDWAIAFLLQPLLWLLKEGDVAWLF